MKQLIIILPNLVSDEEIGSALETFFSELGCEGKVHALSPTDLQCDEVVQKESEARTALKRVIELCGNPRCTRQEVVLSKLTEVLFNHGDPNIELAEVITTNLKKVDAAWIKANGLQCIIAHCKAFLKVYRGIL